MPRKKKAPVEEKKKDPYAPWLSNWFITYNTNRSEDIFIPILEDAWQYILKNIADYLFAGESSPSIRLLAIKQHSAVERGPKFKRIHLHCDLSVDSEGLSMLHYNKIKIDMNQFIADAYSVQYDGDNFRPYQGGACWVRLNKGANRARLVEQYLSKAPLIIPKRTVIY